MATTNPFEELLSQWTDLESSLGVALSKPDKVQQFPHRIMQYDRWMQGLMLRDEDTGLYLLFQLATNSHQGYSTSHSLVCAVLCHLLSKELNLGNKERDSLVRAAMTMNIAMTAIQDELALQADKPTPPQQDGIRMHSIKGAMMLTNSGVADDTWIDTVSAHHDEKLLTSAPEDLATFQKLAVILNLVDRYAAMISPRKSRAARSSVESAQSILGQPNTWQNRVAKSLIQTIGLCPPGTYVQLDSGETGVVVRRGIQTQHPLVAILLKPDGAIESYPRIHDSASAYPRIRSAIAHHALHAQFNHFYILQLGAQTSI